MAAKLMAQKAICENRLHTMFGKTGTLLVSTCEAVDFKQTLDEAAFKL